MKDQKIVPPSSNQRNAFLKRLVLAVLLIDLFIILHAVWSLDKSRNLYEERTAVETGNLARVLEEFIENSMEKVEISLLAIVEETENQLSSGGIDGRKLRRSMMRLSDRLPELASLRMVNEKGEIVYGTDIPEGVIKNIADREYFISAKNGKQAGLVISSPLVSRVSGKLVIVFARRLNRPDGSFGGIASAAVPVEYFLRFFSSVDIGKHGVIVLRDEKLGILIRYPVTKDAGSLIGRRSVSSQLSNLLDGGRKSGTFNATSPVDGVVRKLSVRRFSDFPMYILVGIAEDEYLSKWRDDVREIGASVIISVILSIIFSRLIYSYWIRKNDAYLALSQQEEKFRTVADYTDNWEFWMGPDGEFVYTSPSCEKVSGYDAKAFYTDPGLKERIIHPDDQKLFDDHDHGPDLGIETKSLTFRIIHADGSTRWIEHICRPILDANGVFQGTRGSNRDITRRRETEGALTRSEEQFRTIFNSTADLIIMRDQSFNIVEVNDIACERLGYSREEFLRMDYLKIIYEKDPNRLMGLLEKINLTGQVTYETALVTADGREIPAEVCAKVINFKGRNLVLSIFRDITERKRVENVLRESEERFRTLTEKSPVGVYIIQDDLFRYVNPAFAEMHGYAPEEINNRLGPVDFLTPEDRDRVSESIRRRMTGEIEFSHNEFHIRRKDGSIRIVEIFSSRALHHGRPAALGTIIDVTERKQSEEKLFQVTERWKRTFDAVPDLIAIIDNEFRIVQVNKAMADRMGSTPAECAGQHCYSVVHKTGEPIAFCPHAQTLTDCHEHMAEVSEESLGGHFIVTTSPIYDSTARLMGSVHVARDITDRKKAERRLAELNECFLHFGADSDRNIDRLVALYGEQVGAACAVYSRLEGGNLMPISTWNTPPDFSKAPHSPGHICYEVFHGSKNQVISIENVQQSGYLNTDPKVSRYGIKAYVGRRVSFGGSDMGLLCAVYVDDRPPGEEDKKLLGIIAAAIGVEEERKRALAALKESETTLRSITGSARDAIIMIDCEGQTSFWNETATSLFGWNEAQVLGNNLHSMILPDRYMEAFSKGIKHFANTGAGNAIGKTIELQALRKDGSEVPVEVSLSAVQIKGQWNAVGIIRDITERKRAEAEIERVAYHDALTGLPNRLLLDDRLSQTIALANRTGRMTAVLFFDLDNFKSVNDSFGHPVGDMLLIMVAERLGDRLRKSDTIARMGGDEFIVVLSDMLAPEDAAHAARLFLEAFSDPFQLLGQEIYTSASVGISLYPIDGKSTATLLKNADIAMYQAKKHGRNSFQFFTEEINRRAEERLLLENDLRHAVNRGEFILHYQPWIDLASGLVGGMEALIRWVHPQQGIIPPNRFIPIAEDTGLIIPIGEWVVKTACRFLEELHQRGLKGLKMSVNVSGKQMRSPNLIGLLGLLLADAVFEPSQLEIELTESSVMENLDESRKYMDALKMLGVSLALDDFGTGYSSLSYLKRFPLDRLKIDRSFVRDCPDNPDDVAIARAVIALARALNLQVTAEGVENMAQADFFSREKCDVIQGHLICNPMPGDKLLQLLCGEAFKL